MKRYFAILLFYSLPVVAYAQIAVSFSFDHDSVCSGTQVRFTSTVTSANTSPKLYLWNFGDGSSSNVANPSHVFNPFGCNYQLYFVVLTVTDTTHGLNISNSFQSTLHIRRRPDPVLNDLLNDVDFSNCDRDPTPENADFPVQVQNVTQNTECVTSYTLNWGDGSPPVTNITNHNFIFNHTYTVLGAFNLTITAFGANGCNGEKIYVVKNQSNPAIGLKTDGGTASCAPKTYSFEMSNYLLNSPGTTYQWDFGDDSPRIHWTQDSVLLNSGKIFHSFNLTSCGKINNEFITTVTAYNSCSSTSATVSGIKMWNSPIPDFDINPALGCEVSGLFCFSNLTIPGAYGSNCDRTTTYLWDFGNGNTSNLINPPCQAYAVAGTHTISLTATNKCGSSSTTRDISVQQPPVAIAEADTNSGCVPFPVVFINKSTDSTNLQYTWSVNPATGWNFTNGTNNSSRNPVLQFTVAGMYQVIVTATNKCGSSSSEIIIHANGVPSVAIPPVAGDCFPFTYSGKASYTNNGSAVTAYEWSVDPASGWSFVPPSTTGSPNPVILFSQAGHYRITVKATNICGTGDSTSNQFEILAPLPVTAGNDTSVCLFSGDFQVSATPSGGSWSGINVSAGGIFSPVSVGDHILTYSRGTGNCRRQDQIVVKVVQLPGVNAGNDVSACINNGPLTLTGNPVGGTWSGTGVTDGLQGTFNPSVSGAGSFALTYTLTDYNSQCSNSDAMFVTVFPSPTVIAEDATFCDQPVPEQLLGTPAGGIWSGSEVTSAGLFTPHGTGNFMVLYSYTDNNGCTNTESVNVTVVAPDTTVSAGKDISMCSSESIYLSGSPAGGRWSGSGVTAEGYFKPVTAGDYALVYSTGSRSCFRADSMLVTVRPSPKAEFIANGVCFGETTFFQDQSLGGGVNQASWTWKFGDNAISHSQNPPHYYQAPGIYSATLVVQNESGCSDSVSRPIEVFELPVINFDFDIPACINVPVHFNNHSSNSQSYLWDFGDGNVSELYEPGHLYSNEGSYQVILTGTSGFGCKFTDSSLITITGPPALPHFQLSSREGCSPLEITFSIDTSQYKVNSSYYWDFGNGLTSTSLMPPDLVTYQGSITGDTVIYIRFASYNYCNYFVYSDSVLVHPKPLSRFDMLHPWDCSPVEVQFQNVSTGNPDFSLWDFGDGTTSSESEPVHTFTTDDNSTIYHISLTATNNCGTDTLTQDLLVKPKTVHAFFTVNDFKGCEGDEFCFRNYSTDASMLGISNLSWDFGDGQGSANENPCHIFTQDGIFVVTLNVDNGCGYDEASDTIIISPVPSIEIFANTEACVGETLSFAYTADIATEGKIWYFGDGDSSVLSNPMHSYSKEGNYQVILSAVAAHGFPACIGTAIKQLVVNPVPDAFILPDTSGCVPLQITFCGDQGSSHLWNFGDSMGFTSDPTHTFYTPGLFMVKLISENSSNCRDSDSTLIRVFPSPQSNFTFTSTGGYPEYLTFINSSVGATECQWDFGNGQVSPYCAVDEPVEYSNNDNYRITLVTLNQYGCLDSAIVFFTVNFKGLFIPNALIPGHPDPDENLFLPKGIGIMEYTIQIFDTWGNLIWQSSALKDGMPSEGWNGRDANGNLFPQDVYAWRASAKFSDGTYWSGQNGKTFGTVTLIR